MMRYRLVIPLKRSRHPPDYVARSVAAGLFWAMTPTVGVQMAMVLVHWLTVRRFARWDFNLIHAWAWTWVTNVATVLPVYYVFYVTGQIFLGDWDDLTGYYGFRDLWNQSIATVDATIHADGVTDGLWYFVVDFFQTAWAYFVIILRNWGVPMLIGCIPYAIVCAWLGYIWSIRIVVNHRRAVLDRRLHRHERQLAAE